MGFWVLGPKWASGSLGRLGKFGQSKYSIPSKKHSTLCPVSAFLFFNLYVKRIRSLLIQRMPAGSSHFIVVFADQILY